MGSYICRPVRVTVHLLPPFYFKRLRNISWLYLFCAGCRFVFSHRYLRDQFSVGQCLADSFINGRINFGFSGKTHLSLCGMHINIQVIAVHFDPKGDKRKFMLHDKSLISVLNGLGNDLVFNIPAIDIIILKSTVSSGNLRFPHKALDLHEIIFIGNIQKRLGDLPSVNTVDHVFYTVVSGTGKLHLTVLDIFKGDFRMGKRQLLHQSIDVTGFCHIGFQEFASCRCIVKEVSN